ncbi:hypothetical protein GOP47_0015177 [Adiantum capillus-veneris]|uniref:Pentatricopeptide repeat-containing protein n=1 Tax=Adiantum capillus-veneris TaxID=13818 RepID=A0A9D4UMW4_ADICA|nr:hypothetical protein GOP47_0015177 [Adiantum capillus-veneris]
MNIKRRLIFSRFSSMAERGIQCSDGDLELIMHSHLFNEDVRHQLSLEDFACVVFKYRKEGCPPAHARQLYELMCERGLESSTSLGNQIVCMLVDRGALHQAQKVFDRLALRSDCSWNSLITAYAKCGKPRNAFTFYQKMQEDDVSYASSPTVIALLKLCGMLKDCEQGLIIHVDLVRTGVLERDLYIGSALLDMYLACGLNVKAREVFDEFTAQNVVLWTSLISGYSKLGCGEEALHCYREMQCSGFLPDSITFLCTLKACGTIGAAKEGQEIHAEIERMGFLKKDVVIGNALIDMYAKCGLLNRAREVLDELPVRNVVSWTALITGCVDCGYGMRALHYLKEMQLEGVTPNAVTFASCLRACASTTAIDEASKLHAQLKSNGLLKEDPVVGCALVDMYAKTGFLSKAQDIFDKLTVRNSASWNALILGYAEHGCLENLQSCLERLRREGFSPDAVTFISILKACGSARDVDTGSQVHSEVEKSGLLMQDPFVGSSLVDMYAQCGLLSKAQEVFDRLPARDVIVWNSLLTGYVENGCDEEALICYEKMQDEGIDPDTVTFVCGLKACGSMKALKKGEELHSDIVRKGSLDWDIMIGNALVDMYAKCGSLVKSQEVFDRLVGRDIVSWNALLGGYVQNGEGEQALEWFEQMQRRGISPNSVTFICSLKACGSVGALDKGQAIHAEVERKGLLESDLLVGSALVDFYSKHGSMSLAYQVFTHLPVRNVVSWNALIAGYTQLGESKLAIEMFESMLGEGTKASFVTFVIILNACSQTGLVDKGETYFKTMTKDYGVGPTPEHQICMVDLFSRAGHIEEAVLMLKKLPICGDSSVCHSILGACEKLGNSKFGREVFRWARSLDEKDPSIYTLMASTYAAASISDKIKKDKSENVDNLPIFSKSFWWANNIEIHCIPIFEDKQNISAIM